MENDNLSYATVDSMYRALRDLGAKPEGKNILFPLPTLHGYGPFEMVNAREYREHHKDAVIDGREDKEQLSLITRAVKDALSYQSDLVAFPIALRELNRLVGGEPGYYHRFFDVMKTAFGDEIRAPHCDGALNHPPSTCEYCDGTYGKPEEIEAHKAEAAAIRAFRDSYGIGFAGVATPGKLRCPSEFRRDLDTIHQWGGNRPCKGD
jgi:hypothetical protein